MRNGINRRLQALEQANKDQLAAYFRAMSDEELEAWAEGSRAAHPAEHAVIAALTDAELEQLCGMAPRDVDRFVRERMTV